MKPTSFLLVALTAALLLFAAPVYAQTSNSDTTTTAVNESRTAEEDLKTQTLLNNKERTRDARDINKEYSDKAKDAKRIERDAANASKQAAKAVKLEKKAQKAREKADKQKQVAKEAAKKSDNN